jgi:hypothetical protein
MFRLQEIIGKALNRFFEWSFQRNANKQFRKHDVTYRDGDNT